MICINWFMKMWRSIMGVLDSIIYSLVSFLAQILMSIADITVSNKMLGDFLSRVYIVLGIFMLFKISFSLLNAIVNPDALTDKENGMQKVASRIVIAVALLILTPTIFSKAMELQSYILPAVPRLILGQTGTDSEGAVEMGEEISAISWKSFFSVNEKCKDAEVSKNYVNYNTIDAVGSFSDLECASDSSEFAYDYSWGISAIAGLFLAFIFLTYCLDVAVRAVKLALLQLLAPIPVISYIEPKSAKSGMFSKWVKSCVSTYAELFIKLAVIYLCMYLASKVVSGDAFVVNSTGEKLGKMATVVIIIGIFLFAKQAPKFIGDIFGVEVSSSGSILGKALGWLGGGLASFGGGLASFGGAALGAGLGAGLGGVGAFTQSLFRNRSLAGAGAAFKAGAGAGAAAGTGGIGAGLHQFRNQSNELARELTGDPKFQTGILGAAKRRMTSGVKTNIQRAQHLYDNKWAKANADQQANYGYTPRLGIYSGNESAKSRISIGGKALELNKGDNYITLGGNNGKYHKFEVDFSVVGRELGTTDVNVIEQAMTDPNSDYYNEAFVHAISKRDKYSARANAQTDRAKAKEAKDFQKNIEQMMGQYGYEKKK